MIHYGWRLGYFGFPSFIFSLIFWAIIVILLITLFSHSDENDSEGGGNKTTDYLQIIKKRYAKGEINKKEFEQLRKDLVNPEED